MKGKPTQVGVYKKLLERVRELEKLGSYCLHVQIFICLKEHRCHTTITEETRILLLLNCLLNSVYPYWKSPVDKMVTPFIPGSVTTVTELHGSTVLVSVIKRERLTVCLFTKLLECRHLREKLKYYLFLWNIFISTRNRTIKINCGKV